MKKAKKKVNKKKKVTKKNITKKNISKKSIPKKKVKVRKIRYGRILLFLVLISFIIYLLVHFVNFPIKNIYITGNTNLNDQDIIELLKLENYPSIFSLNSIEAEKKLKKNSYIKDVKIEKKLLKEVHIKITESKPLYYDISTKQTILETGESVDEELNVPTLINYVPDTVYDLFLEKMKILSDDILSRISEIKYDPNDVDEERFLFYMNDGNYIYTTLEKFDNINQYIEIKKTLDNKKGILYLDSGEYFQIFEQ